MNNTRSLATKYRPTQLSEVVEQDSVKLILQHQLDTREFKPAYLFVGPAGTGKTSMGRIFGNEINDHKGNIIELDAASNSSVDNIREIIAQAKTQSIDSEYKIFLIDEVHSLSSQAFQALLKTLEEPPLKSIFILCTTEVQKIPKTILSRVQRYDMQRISYKGITHRLAYILSEENIRHRGSDEQGLSFIARLSDGGLRDAITLLEKCLTYSEDLTIENITKALGIANYDVMLDLLNSICDRNVRKALEQIDTVYQSGVDIKRFIKEFTDFVLDVCKYSLYANFTYIKIPPLYKDELDKYTAREHRICYDLLDTLTRVNGAIKWETNPKSVFEAEMLIFIRGVE